MGHGNKRFDSQYYKRFFQKYSKEEFEMYCRWAQGWFRFLDNYLDLKKGNNRKALELGSSMGYFSKILKDRDFDVLSSDISDYIIKKAKTFQKDVKFLKIDVEKGIKTKENFDYIFAFEVLEHLKNPAKALINIRKKLKKSGILVFSTPFPSKRSLADPTHINVHEEDWWLNLGRKLGFSKRKLVYGTFIPFLYRFSSFFSWGFPLKLDVPYINSTCFYIFYK